MNFSEEAIDLLKQTINLENQRIDLDKIYNHPFFNGGKGLSKDKFPEYNENNKEQFIKELRELPFKEGLILTHRRNDSKNIITFNPQNIIITSSEGSNSNSKNNNNTGSYGKNVSFNLSNENNNYPKILRNSNMKYMSKIKERKKEKDKENSKNESSDYFLENLTKTITDKKQNQFKELLEENLENDDNEEIKTKNTKSKADDNNFDFNNTLATVTFENENDFDKYKNRRFIYIEKIIDNLADYCGIGYQLNNKNIGVFFNDFSQILKLYNNDKFLLYFYKGFLPNNSYTKTKIELPAKNKPDLFKKVNFLIHNVEMFVKNNENKNNNEKDILNEEDESVIIEKYKKRKHLSLFILSNKNIQVNFKDKTKIIFVCCEPKKIIYIDNKEEKSFIQIKNNNFNNFKSNDPEITKKINYAISQINK